MKKCLVLFCIICMSLTACSKSKAVEIHAKYNGTDTVTFGDNKIIFNSYDSGRFIKNYPDGTTIQLFEETVVGIANLKCNSYIVNEKGKFVPRTEKNMLKYPSKEKCYYFFNSERTQCTVIIPVERIKGKDRFLIAIANNNNKIDEKQTPKTCYNELKKSKYFRVDYLEYAGFEIIVSNPDDPLNENMKIENGIIYCGEKWAIADSNKISISPGFNVYDGSNNKILKYKNNMKIENYVRRISDTNTNK